MFRNAASSCTFGFSDFSVISHFFFFFSSSFSFSSSSSFLLPFLLFLMLRSGPPTKEEIAARRQAELDKKLKRQAEWTQMHPGWFLAIMQNDVQTFSSLIKVPGFDLNQRYTVVTSASPIGWATLCDRGEIVAMLVEAGADKDAEIHFFGIETQKWKPLEYAQKYGTAKALHALETSKPKPKMEQGVDFD